MTIRDVQQSYKQIELKNEQLQKSIDKIEYALLGNGDPASGMIIRVQNLEEFEKGTWEWRKVVDRRFFFSIAFQIANFILLGLVAGIFVWTFATFIAGGQP